MSQETEWFEGKRYQRPIILPLICWIGFVLGLIFLLAGLSGCATTTEGPRQEVCMFQLLGQTSNGMPVVALSCVTPEAFAESQK